MSVLACDRNGCDNVMCDRLSHEYGYICHECFKDLVNSGPHNCYSGVYGIYTI